MSASDDSNFSGLISLFAVYYPQNTQDSFFLQNPPVSGSADQISQAVNLCNVLTNVGMSASDYENFYSYKSYFLNNYPQYFYSANLSASKLSQLRDIVTRYEKASLNNPRINATLPVAAANTAPTAGQVGYNNTGISTVGYTAYSCLINTDTASQPNIRLNTFPLKYDGGFFKYNYGLGGTSQLGVFMDLSGALVGAQQKRALITSDAKPIFTLPGYGTSFYFNVNNQRLASAVISTASGGVYDLQLDLSQIAPMSGGKYRVELLGNQSLKSVKINAAKTIFWEDDYPTIGIFQDSLNNTSPTALPFDCFGNILSDTLGVPVLPFAEGGSGYNVAGGVNQRVFIDRLKLAYSMGVDFSCIIYAGGINDANDSAFLSQFESTIKQSVALYPNALHLIAGPFAQNTLSSQSNKIAQEKRMKGVIDRLNLKNVVFIPVMTANQAYIFGRGTTQAPGTGTNAGNVNDYFDNADSTHWNSAGHLAIGTRFARDVVSAIRKYLYDK